MQIWVGEGSRGPNVRAVQTTLVAKKLLTQDQIDGCFGPATCRAIRSFQEESQLPATGQIDEVTWRTLLPQTPLPSLAARCLHLTAAFEGHDYTLAVGNYDGAWLTWGIIGFTLKYGDIQAIINALAVKHPELIESAFGTYHDELIDVMNRSREAQEKWAENASLASGILKQPWRSAFQRFGQFPAVQDEQRRRAEEKYFSSALQIASECALSTEIGVALAFDVRVQNLGLTDKVRTAFNRAVKANDSQLERRRKLAISVTDNCKPQFRRDVLTRKLTIATGKGVVHGVMYELKNWGLAEVPLKTAIGAAAGSK